jgi:hypothetical protein
MQRTCLRAVVLLLAVRSTLCCVDAYSITSTQTLVWLSVAHVAVCFVTAVV